MANRSDKQKQRAHELIDQLPRSQLKIVVRLLGEMVDPAARSIANAPVDREPLTAKEKKALDEACDWLKRNKAIPHEEVLAELGIRQEEIDSYKEAK